MTNDQWHIASVSWGKDSLAMLIMLVETCAPLDEVMFFDTGMEFQAIYDERDRTLPVLEKLGILYTQLKPKNSFEHQMFERPVKKRGTNEIHRYGYGWCGGVCRWGTTEKNRVMDAHAKKKDAVVYVGIAADETKRIEKERCEYKRLPLVEWRMGEQDCLELCYQKGHEWLEQDASEVRLYDVLDRVSCWCCRNKNLSELQRMKDYLPNYWQKLMKLEQRIGEPMKKRCGKPMWLDELFG